MSLCCLAMCVFSSGNLLSPACVHPRLLFPLSECLSWVRGLWTYGFLFGASGARKPLRFYILELLSLSVPSASLCAASWPPLSCQPDSPLPLPRGSNWKSGKQTNKTYPSQFTEKFYIFFFTMPVKHYPLTPLFSSEPPSFCSFAWKTHQHFTTNTLKLFSIFLNNITCKIAYVALSPIVLIKFVIHVVCCAQFL